MTGIDYLMELNKRRSYEFVRDRPQRDKWRKLRRVEIGWIGCMDPRPYPTTITETPLGIWPIWQNIGGKFDLRNWWEFQNSVMGLWDCAKRNKRKLIWVIADHYSRSDDGRLGCKGHGFKTERAQTFSRALKDQFDQAFGKDPDVHTVHVSVDTDEDVITIHGVKDRKLDLGTMESSSEANIQHELQELYPLAPKWIHEPLSEIAMRNIKHFTKVRRAKRPIAAAEHRECVIAVGRGLDHSFHEDYLALTISPFDPNFPGVVKSAGKIICGNIQRSDFDKDRGVVLVAAVPFRPKDNLEDESVVKNIAAYKAMQLAERARKAIEQVSGLRPHLQFLTVTVSMRNQRFEILETS